MGRARCSPSTYACYNESSLINTLIVLQQSLNNRPLKFRKKYKGYSIMRKVPLDHMQKCVAQTPEFLVVIPQVVLHSTVHAAPPAIKTIDIRVRIPAPALSPVVIGMLAYGSYNPLP